MVQGVRGVEETRVVDLLPAHWRAFLGRCDLSPPESSGPPADDLLLWRVVEAFSVVPFENATQINRLHEVGPKISSTELVINDFLSHGTGGTCFALSSALAELLVLFGFDARLCLGRVGPYTGRSYSPNHGAVIVHLGGRRLLCDPGLVFQRPILIPPPERSRMCRNVRECELLVEQNRHEHVLVLFRTPRGFHQHAMVDPAPASRQEFERAWMASFDPLVPADHLYMNKIIDGCLWTVRDRELTRRYAGGAAYTRPASFVEIARRWSMPESILWTAWQRTPYARRRYRVSRQLRAGAKAALDVLTLGLRPCAR